MELDNLISVSPVHPLNAYSSIVVTVSGILMEFILVQNSKAFVPMIFTLSGMLMMESDPK